jgi:cell wall-associated NlpC family hydrolase
VRRPAAGAIVALAALPGALRAQGLALGVSRWLKSPHVTEYKVGVDGFGRGVFRFVVSAEYLEQGGASKAHWYGGTGDVLIRATPLAQPYLIAGAGVGAGRGPTGGGESPGVGAWGGMGVELFTLGPLGVQAEGLYTWRSKVDLSGFAIGLRLGSRIGKREGASRPSVAPPGPPGGATAPAAVRLPIANPADEEAIRLALAGLSPGGAPPPPGAPAGHPAAAEIVVSAIGVMGTPYRWGGTDSTGYDCSGLIQYAYAQHGITLPRRSVDQAAAGREVGEGRQVDSLLPGDILTFSAEPGGQVAHVGLYVGNGRFIHSASKGVAIGVLRADDPAIKWWWERWVGARRIVE